ncbi:hypothetical protein [[Clostridium] dakarense]|uniref:hypothetical protein n=1 Tax=Faecalimicrobium dakarense TaxID=1301100 RepID=UPI0012B5EB73|nr:hypothetical protein [[Clostridium] dakarense]
MIKYFSLVPSAKIFKNLGLLNELGYIKVDKNIKTSIEGIFVVGYVNKMKIKVLKKYR